jgi:hypothetical protein
MRSEGKPAVSHDDDGVIDGEFEEMGGRSSALATVRGGSAMQQVKTQYTTAVAVQQARDLASATPRSVLSRVLREAEICGEDFIYSMTFKGKDGPSVVEGVSIDGAMIMARNFGNCATDVEIVEESLSHWVFRAVFIDLETGFTEPRLFRQTKGTVAGKFDAERKLDMAFQIGQSKAKRNVIVRALPTGLVSKAVEAAKASAAAAIKDLPAAIDWVVKTFGGMGVDLARLEKRIGAPMAQWNSRDVVRMKATYKAIRDRQTTVEAEFPAVEGVPAATTPAPTPAPASSPSAATEPAPAPAAAPEPAPSPAPSPAPAPVAAAPAEEPKATTKKSPKKAEPEPERDPVTGEIVPPAREPGED